MDSLKRTPGFAALAVERRTCDVPIEEVIEAN